MFNGFQEENKAFSTLFALLLFIVANSKKKEYQNHKQRLKY